MKNIKFYLLPLLCVMVLTSCSENEKDKDPEENTSINGSWRLTSNSFGSFDTDGSRVWTDVKDGHKLELKSGGNFMSGEFDCKEGTYKLSDKEITFTFGCETFDAWLLKYTNGEILYSYEIKGKYMILSEIGSRCDEGCLYKFVKVESPD
ncbi:hypothetical protein FUAX_02020 [Fulvitalea axinellae]|uniref:Lipocalin-like domain-containing protein n=1 Tax=Fulvitalea axinellae TaxID=1182444 RepID=A0AAU9D6H6_9BACT|nr:hypothetical protein FUAX_02020 [Fulvitalea axinellae]